MAAPSVKWPSLTPDRSEINIAMSEFIRFISVALLLSFIGCARFVSVPKTTAFDADLELREAYLQEYCRAGILNATAPEEGKQIAYERLKPCQTNR